MTLGTVLLWDMANPMERGHIIPLEAGGTNDPGNYRAECRVCNRGRAGS